MRPEGVRIASRRFESQIAKAIWTREAPRRGENRLEAIRIKSGVLAPQGALYKNASRPERCRSGRTGLIRNQVCAYAYRGFESHPLRQNMKGPIPGLLYFCREGMGFRTLFDQRSRAAACWRGGRRAVDSIPPSPPDSQAFELPGLESHCVRIVWLSAARL